MKTRIAIVLLSACFAYSCAADGGGGGADAMGPPQDVEPETTGDTGQDIAAPETAEDIAAPEGRVDLTWPVELDGPYQAGHRTVEITYEALSTGQNRTIMLHLWYPTEATSGDDVAYVGLFADDAVYGNAPLAAPAVGDAYPLHVHSHGDLGYAGSSPYLMRHFATHGWIVAAPDHTGNTIVDNISPRPSWMYTVRLEDISATLDHLQELPDEDPLAGMIDPNQAVLSGHSYGAYTTLGLAGADYDLERVASICAEEPSGACAPEVLSLFEAGLFEPRVVAAIPMAPGNYAMYGADGVAAVEVPTLHMTGSEDRPEANENIWSALPAPAVRVHVAGGCHQLFALGGCELIDDDTGLPIINGYALAFARHHLLGDEGVSGLLDGTTPLDEAVTLSVK